MTAKRMEMAEEEFERAPEELRKDRTTVKTPRIDSFIASEIRNLEKDCGSCDSEIRPTIPNELVADILLRLPADVLYNVMRLVCKSWLNIINDPEFVSKHAHTSAYTGFLSIVSYSHAPSAAYFLEIGNGNRNDNGLGKGKEQEIFHIESRRGTVIGSCEGVVFIGEFNNKGEEQYHILNPVTREVVTYTLPKQDITGICSGGIGYARSSGKYKVVHPTSYRPLPHNILIFTLGVDNSWRCIKREQTKNIASGYYCYALPVGGFIYWHGYQHSVVLALDVEDETLHQVHTPIDQHSINQKNCEAVFIKSESFLVFVFLEGDAVFDFWALVNPKTGEWEKLCQVKLNGERERHSLCRLIGPCSNKSSKYSFHPRAILNDDIVIFYVREADIYVGYVVKTGAMFQYREKDTFHGRRRISCHGEILVHRQTLVRLK